MRNTSEMAAVRGFNTFARSVTFPAIATTNILVELGGILHVSLIGTPHISWNRVSKEACGTYDVEAGRNQTIVEQVDTGRLAAKEFSSALFSIHRCCDKAFHVTDGFRIRPR